MPEEPAPYQGMTTRRTPKPLPNPATSFLLENCLPFLSIDTEGMVGYLEAEGPKKTLRRLSSKIVPILAAIPEAHLTADHILEAWGDKASVGHLIQTAMLCQAMIRTALLSGQGNTVGGRSLTAAIAEAMENMHPFPCWFSPGRTRLLWLPYKALPTTEAERQRAWLPGIRGHLAATIGESLSSWSADFNPRSNGSFYIFACEACGKVAAKDDDRRQTCNESCRAVLYRRNQKE